MPLTVTQPWLLNQIIFIKKVQINAGWSYSDYPAAARYTVIQLSSLGNEIPSLLFRMYKPRLGGYIPITCFIIFIMYKGTVTNMCVKAE